MKSTLESKLCEICLSIPFEKGPVSMKNATWRLGSLLDLRNRESCPFCRLVLQGVLTANRIQGVQGLLAKDRFVDNSCIEITWTGHFGHSGHFTSSKFVEGSFLEFLCDEACDETHDELFESLFGWQPERKRTLNSHSIDISRVRHWVSVCSENHPRCLPPQSTSDDEIPNFRVIDVRRKCISTMPSSIKYVALSYVWGQVDTYQLRQGNLVDLMESEGLARVWGYVPQTIRDAIWFTEAIGENYLWVDTLCLVQDDIDDIVPGVKYMDVVFGRAFCTIVAASGENANAGLPGVGNLPRTTERVSEVHPGIRVMLQESVDTQMQQTRYNRRAWTFQEYLLSRRRIVFLSSQAYYICRTCCLSEDHAKVYDRRLISVEASVLSVLQQAWVLHHTNIHAMFMLILNLYSKRQLTYESDILNAMNGICRILSTRLDCNFIQGMPAAALDLYLLFQTMGTTERRPGFPSYSWAGWQGEVFFEIFTEGGDLSGGIAIEKQNYWLANQTWMIWYINDPSIGAISHTRGINQSPGFLEVTEDDKGNRGRQSFRPQIAANRLFRNQPTTEPSPCHVITDLMRYSYPLLQSWTIAVYFNVTVSKEQRVSRFRGSVLDILDRNGVYCGCVRTDQSSPDIHMDSEPIELILLSEVWGSENPYRRHYWHVWREIEEHMRKNPATEEYSREYENGSLFWALWIRWDEGIAERVGIAQIFRAAIQESLEPGQVWKEIILG